MAYATVTQATDLYGTAYITIACDRDGNGTLDTTSFEKHLATASKQIDAYLLGRYALPLSSPPEYFQKLAVDIAVYNACPTADVRTVEMTDRYKEAIRYLEMIAQNKIKLETSTNTTEANASASSSIETKTTIEIVSDDRQFRRDNLKQLL